jgi:hypothetical protein
MSMQSRTGGGSRASDEDSKTAVKVGEYTTSGHNPAGIWQSERVTTSRTAAF